MSNAQSLWHALRAWWQFHENEKIIAWVQNQRAVVWLTPARRRAILCFGALVAGLLGAIHRYRNWRYDDAAKTWPVPVLAFLILIGFLYSLYLAARHFQRLPLAIRRRPQITLHLLFWAILSILWLASGDGGLWRKVFVLVAISLPYLLWRCGYMVMSGQRGKAKLTTFYDHLFYLWPIWGGSNAPVGKGLDYLSQCEAKTNESYARSVLAALKLLILSLMLELAKLILRPGLVIVGVPHIKSIATGKAAASLFTTWISLYVELISDTVNLAARGHRWVAALRLFGFNVFRNTYKPLLAESIVDFWNRYYYYFKELLVEFFFFPTYLRCFRTRPKLRMFAAVFAAAFVGNMYYHLWQAKDALVAGLVVEAAQSLSPRMLYCLPLALGIYVSMLRQNQRRGKAGQRDAAMEIFIKLRRIAGVWTFYSLINYWNLKTGLSISARIAFFLSLFGL